MKSRDTSTDAQLSNTDTNKTYDRALGRRSFLQGTGALASISALTALAGCTSSSSGGGGDGTGGDTTPKPKPSGPTFPLTATVSEPYHFYRNIIEYEDYTEYHGPVWYVDLTFDLAVNIDDWVSTDEYPMPTMYVLRVSENGGNPDPGRIFHINKNEGWYRVEDKWFVEKSEFVVDGAETEFLVLGYGEDDEPDAGTDYAIYLEDRTNQDFHELVSFTYDGDPTERTLLDETFWN